MIDDDPLAPELITEADDAEEWRFDDEVTSALSFLERLHSNDTDMFALYLKELPTDRLTQEDETALGIAIQEGVKEVLAALTESPAVVSKLRANFEAVLRGEMLVRAMFGWNAAGRDSSGETSSEADEVEDTDPEAATLPDAILLPLELSGQLMAILNSCRPGYDKSALASRLFLADLAPDYFRELERIAEQDAAAKNARERIGAGRQKGGDGEEASC